jgi:hypothetical protein
MRESACGTKQTCLTLQRMSAFGGVVSSGRRNTLSETQEKKWTGDGSKICSRVQRGGQGGVVEPRAVRIRSSTEWLDKSNNGRERLWASKPEPNEI